MSDTAVSKAPELDFDTPQLVRYRKNRNIKDQVAKFTIGMGGISVIVAITLIFFYLLYEVAPLFKSAETSAITSYSLPAAERGDTIYSTIEEQGEKAMRVTQSGYVVFFNTADGSVHSEQRLPIPEEVEITSITHADPASRTVMAGLSNGQVLIFKHSYKITYPNNVRVIDPFLEFPFGEEPMAMDEAGKAIAFASMSLTEDAILIVGANSDNDLFATKFIKEESFLSGEITLEPEELSLPSLGSRPVFVVAEPGMRWIFIATQEGTVEVFDIFEDQMNGTVKVGNQHTKITGMQLLLGGASVLITEDSGRISQWFMVRDDNNQYSFENVRQIRL